MAYKCLLARAERIRIRRELRWNKQCASTSSETMTTWFEKLYYKKNGTE